MAQTQSPAKHVKEGSLITYAGASVIYAGDVILVGTTPTIAAANDPNLGVSYQELHADGVFDVPKVTGAIVAGDPIFWNPTGSPVVGTASTGAAQGSSTAYPMGMATQAAASGDAYVRVRLQPTQTAAAFGVAGASTIALGTNSGNAAVLPAGTSRVYPTTAADDTVGVRINAADKVTGRTLFIGNGVANKILKVYPPTGGTINGASADAAFSSASGKGVFITCLDSTANTWLAS